MANLALIGATIEAAIFIVVGLFYLDTYLRPQKHTEARDKMENLPVFSTIFKYKYSYPIIGSVCLLAGFIHILRYVL